MAARESQLVQMIAAEVIRTLKERGLTPPTAPRADIKPPIGVCTGDYSKFPELKGKLGGAASATETAASADPRGNSGAAAATESSAPVAVPLTGIITARQLQEAMDASSPHPVTLAADARLSPLANDIARQFAQRIRRADATSTADATAGPGKDAAALPWLWWIDGHCPAVRQVAGENRERLRASTIGQSSMNLARAVRELAAALRAGQVAGGLLFVHNAARAACMANRCASIRAVVGTCGEAVEQGITELGANVLIVEYPHHGYRSASGMVTRILQQPPRVPPAVQRDLGDLHRCG